MYCTGTGTSTGTGRVCTSQEQVQCIRVKCVLYMLRCSVYLTGKVTLFTVQVQIQVHIQLQYLMHMYSVYCTGTVYTVQVPYVLNQYMYWYFVQYR